MAWLGAAAAMAGCTTTHAVARFDDPRAQTQLADVASRGRAVLHVRTDPGRANELVRPIDRERPGGAPPNYFLVTGVAPSGLLTGSGSEAPSLVGWPQIASVSEYDHLRGARDGAIIGGLAGLGATLTLGLVLVATSGRSCSDGCAAQPDPAPGILEGSALVGLVGAVIGAAIGAAAGHQERYVPAER